MKNAFFMLRLNKVCKQNEYFLLQKAKIHIAQKFLRRQVNILRGMMKRYIYPAVFIKDQDYRVIFPDLELTTDGDLVEEAYLYAKECLKAYFAYVEKHDFDFNMPTDFECVKKSANSSDIVMLIDAEISTK